MPKEERDLIALLVDDIEEIETGVRDYRAGQLSAYQRVATQLGNLLTDRTRSGALLERAIPGATLEALLPSSRSEPIEQEERLREENAGETITMTFDTRGGGIRLTAGGPNPGIEFSIAVDASRLLSVDDWVDQWVVNEDVRIGELIREVRNKDAAHTDASEGPTMRTVGEVQGLVGGRVVEMKRPLIVGIGEYVAARIRQLLAERDLD